jgi:tetratricopeptide (TPR) repeat protein
MRARLWAGVLWAGLLCAGSAAADLGPFERNHPRAEEGLKAFGEGRYEDALQAFSEAKKELPDSLALDFNRAEVLAEMGRLQEAKALFGRLSEVAPPPLRQKAAYNLGNVHAQLSERKEAIAAYRRALALDSADADARHNLEVVLRNLKPPEPPAPDAGRPDSGEGDGGRPQDGGTPDGGSADGGTPDGGGQDGGMRDGGQGQPADGGPADGGSRDGGPPDGGGGKGEGDPADGGEGDGDGSGMPDAGDEASDGGLQAAPREERDIQPGDAGVPPGELSREEAESLLDALKQNEKNLQLWRFQRRKGQRNADEKDW